jgi:hypothetical protein
MSNCNLHAFNAATFGQYMFSDNASQVFTLANNTASLSAGDKVLAVNAWGSALDAILPTESWSGTKTINVSNNGIPDGAGLAAYNNLTSPKGYLVIKDS